MDCRPHDLLWLERLDAFQPAGELPAWLDGAWMARAPLVVRRAAGTADRVPVGARGLQRSERCAGHAQAGAIVRRVSPAMLAQSLPERVDPAAAALPSALPSALPCVAALLSLAPRLNALGLDWGPAGGTGFWLASSLPVLRPSSDLDLVVHAPTRLDRALLEALCALQASAPCRLDIQIDTGIGGFALSEFAGGARRTLLKTAHGPRLLADPWAQEEAA
jgi:phosphoribosyl-dephospho-CoA transferase